MKHRFDLLVFDWDGTLFDSIDWIVECLQHAARVCDCEVPSSTAAKAVIGLSLAEAMAELFPQTPRPIQRLVDAYQDIYATRDVSRRDLFSGVPQMLETLQGEGYWLAVATGKSRDGLNRALESTAMAPFFDTVRCAEETASKPDPAMLVQIMTELGVDRERTLMIGDSVHDLRMATNAGIEAVGVACGANTRDQLLALNPLIWLGRTTDLQPMLV
jgi:phosphoglycolate phosphatase